MPPASSIAHRLGGPARRRQRHRRVAIGAGALLAVAGGLILLGGGDDGGFDDDATEVCTGYTDRIQAEFDLSFPDGPADADAFAEYLSHAFADTMDDLVAELDALDPPDDAAAAVDGYRAVLADIRERPLDFATSTSPFQDPAEQMDAAGVPACGSEFFAALLAQE